MTGSSPTPVVGAVFADRASAAAAAEALRRAGMADAHLTADVWTGSPYVVATATRRRLLRGLAIGMLAGAVVGAVAGVLAGAVVWDTLGMVPSFAIGAGGGFALGATIGAYVGLNRRRPELWDRRDWTHLTLQDGEILLVVEAGGAAGTAEGILQEHGGRRVEPRPAA
jgi:hypothetical protein